MGMTKQKLERRLGRQSSHNINQTMPNIKPYIIYLPRFFSFCLLLGGKWPFFSYQVVIAVLFLQVKTKNGIVVRKWQKQPRQISGKEFWCKEQGKPLQNPLNLPSVSLD